MQHQFSHLKILCSGHNAFMCFVRISEQTVIISLHSSNLSVFITEAESVYSAVRTGSLNKAVCALCNIQQLYVLPTLYLCVLYLSENK